MPLYIQPVTPPSAGMTAGRVEVASTGYKLVDYSNFTYDGNILKIGTTLDLQTAGPLAIGPSVATSISVGGATTTSGLSMTAGNAANTGTAIVFNTSNTWTGGNYVYRFQNNGANLFIVDSAGALISASGTFDRYTLGAMNVGVSGGSSIALGGTSSVTTTVSGQQVLVSPAVTTAGSIGFRITPANHTAITAGSEILSSYLRGNSSTWATGALATQRFYYFEQSTINFAGASTATTSATVAIQGPPLAGTNATLTNAYALWVQGGIARFDGNIQFSDGTTQSTASGGPLSGLTATRIPVATSGSAVANSNFTASANALDIFASGALSFGASFATSITAGNSANTLWDARAQQFLVRQQVVSSGTPAGALVISGAIHTGLTNAEALDVNFSLNRTVTFAGSATPAAANITLQRAVAVQAPTYAFGSTGAQTIGDAVTLEIIAAPVAGANTTITNAWALRATGNVKFTSGGGTGFIQLDDATGAFFQYAQQQIKVNSLGTQVVAAAISTGNARVFWVTGAAHINLATTTEVIGANFNLSQIKTWATGAIATQREVLFQAPTYAFSGPSTITTAATLAINGPPIAGTNATLTATYPFWVQSGTSRFDGALATGTDNANQIGTAALRWSSIYGVALFGNSLEVSSGTALTIGASTSNTITLGRGTATTVNSTIGAFTVTQGALAALGSTPALRIVGGAHTTMNASTEINDVYINLARTIQWATGAITTQRACRIDAPTYAFVATSTITTASTVSITGAPVAGTNATITNPFALNLEAGNLGMAPAAVIKNSSQGATNTIGLTINPNIADGATGAALVIKNGTATTTAALVQFRTSADVISAQIELDTITAGSVVFRQPNTTYLAFLDSGNNGFKIQSGVTYARAGGTDIWQTVSTGLQPFSDLNVNCGAAATRWLNTYSQTFVGTTYVTKTQTVTAAATTSINPALGGVVKMNYVSATNVTAMTLQAGSDGQVLTLMLIQPGAGTPATMVAAASWTNASFAGGAVTFTATLAKRDVFTFVYDSTTSKWYEQSRALNLSN